jgi:anti-sigma regulatory factor (Ser/Thr protein kinase)
MTDAPLSPPPANSNFLSIELPPKLEASAYARKATRGAFRELPERVLSDLLLVVSELVTNAVQHGPGKPISLAVGLDAKTTVIRGDVTDQGDPSESIPRIREVTRNRGRGYGLRLVDAMTSEWAVVEGSTSVQFEIPVVEKQ